MRLFLLFLCELLLAGGTYAATATVIVVPPIIQTTETRTLIPFTQVAVEGKINVNLHTGYATPQVILRGDPRDLAQVRTEVIGGVLVINLGKGYPRFGNISADIRGNYLNIFTYHGIGIINGKHLRSGLLDLNIANEGKTMLGGNIFLRRLEISGTGYTEINGVSSQQLQLALSGKPRVQLIGMTNLSDLELEGEGWLGMYWIKSTNLRIRAKGAAFIQLGGIVNKLDVELWDIARFNGRYLRAKRAFVKTHDHAVAEITALDHQHTLATDASDIYFYHIPGTRADFMAYDGSVLDMREWDREAMRDYDRFNK